MFCSTLFLSTLIEKKIFRQPEPEFAQLICINRQEMFSLGNTTNPHALIEMTSMSAILNCLTSSCRFNTLIDQLTFQFGLT